MILTLAWKVLGRQAIASLHSGVMANWEGVIEKSSQHALSLGLDHDTLPQMAGIWASGQIRKSQISVSQSLAIDTLETGNLS